MAMACPCGGVGIARSRRAESLAHGKDAEETAFGFRLQECNLVTAHGTDGTSDTRVMDKQCSR